MRKRILVADDSKTIREAISIALSGEPSLDLQLSKSGQMTLALVTQEPFDLILLSAKMHDIDSLIIAEELKKDPRTSKTPLMILAGRSYDPQKTYQYGAIGVIRKPFLTEELLSRVSEVLQTSYQKLPSPIPNFNPSPEETFSIDIEVNLPSSMKSPAISPEEAVVNDVFQRTSSSAISSSQRSGSLFKKLPSTQNMALLEPIQNISTVGMNLANLSKEPSDFFQKETFNSSSMNPKSDENNQLIPMFKKKKTPGPFQRTDFQSSLPVKTPTPSPAYQSLSSDSILTSSRSLQEIHEQKRRLQSISNSNVFQHAGSVSPPAHSRPKKNTCLDDLPYALPPQNKELQHQQPWESSPYTPRPNKKLQAPTHPSQIYIPLEKNELHARKIPQKRMNLPFPKPEPIALTESKSFFKTSSPQSSFSLRSNPTPIPPSTFSFTSNPTPIPLDILSDGQKERSLFSSKQISKMEQETDLELILPEEQSESIDESNATESSNHYQKITHKSSSSNRPTPYLDQILAKPDELIDDEIETHLPLKQLNWQDAPNIYARQETGSKNSLCEVQPTSGYHSSAQLPATHQSSVSYPSLESNQIKSKEFLQMESGSQKELAFQTSCKPKQLQLILGQKLDLHATALLLQYFDRIQLKLHSQKKSFPLEPCYINCTHQEQQTILSFEASPKLLSHLMPALLEAFAHFEDQEKENVKNSLVQTLGLGEEYEEKYAQRLRLTHLPYALTLRNNVRSLKYHPIQKITHHFYEQPTVIYDDEGENKRIQPPNDSNHMQRIELCQHLEEHITLSKLDQALNEAFSFSIDDIVPQNLFASWIYTAIILHFEKRTQLIELAEVLKEIDSNIDPKRFQYKEPISQR